MSSQTLSKTDEPTQTNNSFLLKKPVDHLSWSVVNLLCCCCGFCGLFCSLPALMFSCKVRDQIEIDVNDIERLEAYSRHSKRLNIVATVTYIMFGIGCFISVLIIIGHLKLFYN